MPHLIICQQRSERIGQGKTCAPCFVAALGNLRGWLLGKDVQVESLVPESEGHDSVSQRLLAASVASPRGEVASDSSRCGVRGAGRILSSTRGVVQAVLSTQETALCNKQCHLLGGAGTMTLWAVLHVLSKRWDCFFVPVGFFFVSNKCFKNQSARSRKSVLMCGNASPHLASLFYLIPFLRENFKLCFGVCLKEVKFINC